MLVIAAQCRFVLPGESVGMTLNLPTPGEAAAVEVFATRYNGDLIRATADDD